MGIQTIMLSAVWGPILGFFNFLKMALAMLFILPMAVLRIATKGPKSLARYDKLFEFLSGIFLGKFFFSQLVGALAPYSASIGARILKVTQEEVIVEMDDRPWLRNPFDSVHAIALANLGELSGGLAFMAASQYKKGVRGIPTKAAIEYHKKARGTIRAVAKVTIPKESCDLPLSVDLTDRDGEVVATVTFVWKVQVSPAVAKKDT